MHTLDKVNIYVLSWACLIIPRYHTYHIIAYPYWPLPTLQVRYVMRCIFGDPKNAPPPMVRWGGKRLVSVIWKRDSGNGAELLQWMGHHVDAEGVERP